MAGKETFGARMRIRSPFPAVAPTVLTALLLAACGEPRFHEQDNPLRLSDWNLFTQEGSLLLPREQTMVFQPANPLFSDYAGKLHTLWLPKGQPARIEQGELEFPPGAVLSKTFYYPTDGEGAVLDSAGNADRLDRRRYRILETRLLVRRMDGWHAMAYVWNEEQSEAFLRVAGASIPLRLGRPSGTEDFVYFVPNENQCAGCHVTSHPDGPLRPLGAVPAQLAAATQPGYLQTMEARGWLDRAPETPAAPSWEDESADLATRAGAYLDIHCGHCHNPDGAADTSALVLDGSHDNPLELGVCKSPVAAGGGAGDLLYSIHPGAPERSILLYRMESSELDEMMPELGRSLIHVEGAALIRDWIAGMAGDCPELARALEARAD